ncbi:MAG TPA: hypothetical protein VKT33_06965 [Candidatus Angelobacter sp.]|nr:hypothetical protein [Candidatus Angelobacter sp.]
MSKHFLDWHLTRGQTIGNTEYIPVRYTAIAIPTHSLLNFACDTPRPPMG